MKRPIVLFASIALACGSADLAGTSASDDDLSAGAGAPAGSTDWGAATTCKALATGLPALKSPRVLVSLDGLTLHLWDQAGTFDKVYPIGPGAIENGVSLTPVGHFSTGPVEAGAGAVDDGTTVGKSPWAWWYRCKIWWTDPDTKEISPVYAGLPLIRLKGAPTTGYAIHGPIDGFGAPNGGSLRRGFVSHGCIRMRAEDIVEVYGLLHGHGNAPVTIQRAIERDASGRSVDLTPRWMGSECQTAADCGFAGAICHSNSYGRSYCTQACNGSCPDRAGEIATACVPDGSGGGVCVRQASALDNSCRMFESFKLATQTQRYGSSKAVDACVPGSSGFVGDPCLSSADCASGRTCERHSQGPGFCTQACSATNACPSANGLGSTCAAGRCLRSCDVQDACGGATGTTCKSVAAGVSACSP